ncbi:MAG: ABC transporter ATP-binding protein/permease [Roseobacter sp.]
MWQLTRFWGLISAYWRSERWIEAWSLTVLIFAITTLLSKASVWIAMSSADFITALAEFHAPELGTNPIQVLVSAVGVFFAVHLGRACVVAVRHFVSATLHRRARAWLAAQFNAAILADERVAFDLMSDRASTGTASRMPDAIDQRVDECSMGLYGGLIGLSMGLWGAIASIGFISQAILQRSQPVAFLDQWGSSASDWVLATAGIHITLAPGNYGTAVLVAVLVIIYVPVITWVAWRIGRVLERQTLERQRHDGAWRNELGTMLNRVTQLAASRGERTQRKINTALYDQIDGTWGRQNVWGAAMMMFTQVYSFLSQRLLAYLPGLPAYMAGHMSFRNFAATSELTAELINDVSWFINVMPAIATLRANASRLMELAQAVERVRARDDFYAETGVSQFERVRAASPTPLALEQLALHHRGHDTEPFVQVPALAVQAGEWVYFRGENGCGKSSVLKAVAGLWPYGSGQVALAEGQRLFFAGQEPDLPDRLSLKALLCYPEDEGCYDDIVVAHALSCVGLGEFISALHEPLFEGNNWRNVLSGGQKQRLVLARITLHKPDVLLLDEATSALDPNAAVAFHTILQKAVPQAAVLAVLHGNTVPKDPDGMPFYHSILDFRDGVGSAQPVVAAASIGLAAE